MVTVNELQANGQRSASVQFRIRFLTITLRSTALREIAYT
jgi:hypothetical protein